MSSSSIPPPPPPLNIYRDDQILEYKADMATLIKEDSSFFKRFFTFPANLNKTNEELTIALMQRLQVIKVRREAFQHKTRIDAFTRDPDFLLRYLNPKSSIADKQLEDKLTNVLKS